MNNGIIGEKIAVSVKFEVVAGFIEQHLLGVFQMLPHRQFGGFGIFTHQGFEDLVVVFTPALHRPIINMLMQFSPIRVVFAVLPDFFHQRHQHGILRGLGNLNMELFIPLRITRAIFFLCGFLNGQ